MIKTYALGLIIGTIIGLLFGVPSVGILMGSLFGILFMAGEMFEKTFERRKAEEGKQTMSNERITYTSGNGTAVRRANMTTDQVIEALADIKEYYGVMLNDRVYYGYEIQPLTNIESEAIDKAIETLEKLKGEKE